MVGATGKQYRNCSLSERVDAMKKRFSAIAVRLAPVVILGLTLLVSCARKVELDEDFQAVVNYTFGASREPLVVIEDRVRASHGDAAGRLAIELQLAELLKREDTTRDCKDFACRQLRIVGTSKSVPALAALLTDESLSDMARYALQLNTDPSVDKALIAALKKAQGLPLIGIINTLGERKSSGAASALEPLASNPDAGIADAAIDALAKIRR